MGAMTATFCRRVALVLALILAVGVVTVDCQPVNGPRVTSER